MGTELALHDPIFPDSENFTSELAVLGRWDVTFIRPMDFVFAAALD